MKPLPVCVYRGKQESNGLYRCDSPDLLPCPGWRSSEACEQCQFATPIIHENVNAMVFKKILYLQVDNLTYALKKTGPDSWFSEKHEYVLHLRQSEKIVLETLQGRLEGIYQKDTLMISFKSGISEFFILP